MPALYIKVQQNPASVDLCVRFAAEPANQELASTATPEPIHNNNTDIIEIDESTTILIGAYYSKSCYSCCLKIATLALLH